MITRMRTTRDETGSWKQNLHAIWFAELVAIIGFSVVIPILPLYVRELGVQDEAQVKIWSGVVFSAHGVTMAVFGPIWGALGDHHGRKLMVERAMFGGALMMTLMGLVQSPLQLTLLRAVQGALTGTVTAATALVATSAPKDRAGYALGTLQMAIYVGASAGPLVGGVVADALSFRAAFFVTGGLLFAAAMGVLVFVNEPSAARTGQDDPVTAINDRQTLRKQVLAQLEPVLASAPLLSVMSVRLVMRLAARLARPTLPLFVETIAPAGARVATLTGLISGANAVGGAIGGRMLGPLGDRMGYRKILTMCAIGSALAYLPQSLVSRSMWLIPLQAAAGLAMGGILASISASLAALAPQGREGIVYGVDASVVSVANAIAPMTGSYVAASLGLRAPFLVAAVFFGAGAMAALRLLPKPRSAVS